MRPLLLVTLSGGLGNQMFQYAFLLRLRRRGARVFPYFGKLRRYAEHNGYELGRVFGVVLSPAERRLDTVFSIPLAGEAVRHLLFPFKYRERGLSDYGANASALRRRNAATRFTGYWQSERFFADVAGEVRRLYRFDESRLNRQSLRLAETLRGTEDSVSLHVRRGDYVRPDGTPTDFSAAVDPDYHDRALERVASLTGRRLRVWVFSDDADWCRRRFPAHFSVVDWNSGLDSWQDMCLMSMCRHHIVANSSFSWWGAWLDSRPGSCIIAPKKWLRGSESPDITPPTWIRL